MLTGTLLDQPSPVKVSDDGPRKVLASELGRTGRSQLEPCGSMGIYPDGRIVGISTPPAVI
jgi:hypothetical protein